MQGGNNILAHKITGMMIYYNFICKRKLWYFLHEIQMEQDNEDVRLGKELDQTAYASDEKHITINDEISIDFINTNTIHEIKKSKSNEKASIWQTKYYLYYLEKHGVEKMSAQVDYPLQKKTESVLLAQGDNAVIEKAIYEIEKIKNDNSLPDKINLKKMCEKCAYHDYCYL